MAAVVSLEGKKNVPELVVYPEGKITQSLARTKVPELVVFLEIVRSLKGGDATT